jgi:acetylornithine deacetylase
VEFVQSYLEDWGVASRLVASKCGAKANLYASIGPQVAGGVVLSGHTDVVPIDGQKWQTDPFAMVQRSVQQSAQLFGRGTCDMKGFIAIALALVPRMGSLKRPIHLALSYDEEIGCLGAPSLIRALSAELPPVRAVIVGEPTSMQVVTAHKGICIFETRITGHEVHSSQQHRGVSAIMAAGRLLHWLAERQQGNAQAADADCEFEPGFSTLHCGTITGGTAHNITARDCRFMTDIRALPTESAADHLEAYREFAKGELEPAMRAVREETGIAIEVLADVPGFQADPDDEAVALVKNLTGNNHCECVPYAAEAGQFQQAGYSVVICGPGSIDQAHQPNEFISVAQMQAGTEFVERLIDHLSRG